MPRLLLHVCCGPCLIAPLSLLRSEAEWETTGFWFNPNIHPYTEYRRRLDTLIRFALDEDLPLILRDEYALESFLAAVSAQPDARCGYCYTIRLQAAAERAKAGGFDAFSSTLLYSRYQKHDEIRRIGEEIGQNVGIPFHYRDFRTLWDEGVRLAKAREMYRQPYCGCIYSEKDRYCKEKKIG
jgi:predicted adenine nucleotide alpha hydrolase (AANH) superfamily ATPase